MAELQNVSRVIVAYSKNGWMNESLTVDCAARRIAAIEGSSVAIHHWLCSPGKSYQIEEALWF